MRIFVKKKESTNNEKKKAQELIEIKK